MSKWLPYTNGETSGPNPAACQTCEKVGLGGIGIDREFADLSSQFLELFVIGIRLSYSLPRRRLQGYMCYD